MRNRAKTAHLYFPLGDPRLLFVSHHRAPLDAVLARMHSYRYIFVPTSIILASAPQAFIRKWPTAIMYSPLLCLSFLMKSLPPPPPPRRLSSTPCFLRFSREGNYRESIFIRVENFMTLLISVQLFPSFRSSH